MLEIVDATKPPPPAVNSSSDIPIGTVFKGTVNTPAPITGIFLRVAGGVVQLNNLEKNFSDYSCKKVENYKPLKAVLTISEF